MDEGRLVWLFHAEGGRFASGVFSSVAGAEAWIAQHRLTGLLTGYPIDEGAYEWATRIGAFIPKSDEQRTPEFIGRFAPGRHHYHFERGERVS